MQINRLRLLGFKSFVEPTELVIEPGLTGVVGPNGCGKSNLLEALRWVMGETSHKSMRAAAMDDVIFAGTTTRPARNVAEVTIFIDNSAHTAPSEYNGHDVIEITRRIEREAGSAYRVNGADVRARDVKILFEDAATGARSPALVRQGQISEIVNAKPEHRRRILEDAAGVAGLHSRRHDAELRLKAAEANLARLADIMGSFTSQIDSLKRQARQAKRYRELSIEIRKAEAVAAHVGWLDAQTQYATEKASLGDVLSRLGNAVEAESKALLAEAALADSLNPLREAEAVRGAVLARLKIEHANFDREAERAANRQRELAARVVQFDADIAREAVQAEEAAEMLVRLDYELMELAEAEDGAADAEDRSQAELDAAKRVETEAAGRLAGLMRRDVEQQARRKSLDASLGERREQLARLERQVASLDVQLREFSVRPDGDRLAELEATVEELEMAIDDGESQAIEAEERAASASADAKLRREAAQQISLELRGVDTEQATLARILRPRSGDGFTPVLDLLTVALGYEAALGAALGDDLDAPISEVDEALGPLQLAAGPLTPTLSPHAKESSGPLLHWRIVEAHADDPALPDALEKLSDRVAGPKALLRSLDQVGVVDREGGSRLQPRLKPGQRLVSLQGDLWRWDGFVAAADAPTASAERLAQKNRLSEIEQRQAEIKAKADAALSADRVASSTLAKADEDGRRARQTVRDAAGRLAKTREQLELLLRGVREAESRCAVLSDQQLQASEALVTAHERVAEIELTIEATEDADDLAAEIGNAEAAMTEARARFMRLSNESAGLQRERMLRSERLATTRNDRQRWAVRQEASGRQVGTLHARAEDARRELDSIADLPAEIEAQRHRLTDEIALSESMRNAAADALATAEAALRQARQDLRAAQGDLATEREARARFEARLEAARNRHDDECRKIRETLRCEPEDCLALAEFPAGATLPVLEEIEKLLARLKADRERLGGVNLAAEQELDGINEQLEKMDKERGDVEAAIAKLRGAIGQLNREGRKRIDEAFQAVNGHFQSLFTTLFNGGEARLEMIESDDPLEGGLEIVAKPPGKKPATLSLLSGGEQTLTALSLIFAVFLTNPSPICVLDEVDAPLDDANVDRFSTLMEKMAADTATRFLVITHHPMTMARMNRLYGVTMGEKGVSQLVSVDLAAAERIIEDDDDAIRRIAG